MEKEFKFKLGDLVKHKASGMGALKLLVIGVGYVSDENGTANVYVISFTKSFSTEGNTFGRAYLDECELEYYNTPVLEPNTTS